MQATITSYHHTQRAPLCLLVYLTAVPFFIAAFAMAEETPAGAIGFAAVGGLMLLLAACFHHLAVSDGGDRLLVRFGPIPLFRTSIPYRNMRKAEAGRTLLLDGWGIHLSMRGGWVWNIWGRDCVMIEKDKGVVRIGTDDAANLAAFLTEKIAEQGSLAED